jgi:predicted amidohydrolase YtcJ
VLISRADVWRRGLADVRITGSRIAAIAAPGALAALPGESAIDAAGGALLPGLHDHHIHLPALAARRASVVCGPPAVEDAEALATALRTAPGRGWIRGVGYHESVMGLPSARDLDRLVADRPLRIQHRSGRLWLFNSAALDDLLARGDPPPGLDRATGHLFDEDAWLRITLAGSPPDLGAASRELAACGVTGVTEMSPSNGADEAAYFTRERARGALAQTLLLAGRLDLCAAPPDGWTLGPAKLHLHEAALPDFVEAVDFVRLAHDQSRGVAIHCTTEVEIVFALALLAEAGATPADRIEHAGIATDEHVAEIVRLGLAVVSQPHFIAERGDRYLADVDPRHHTTLYRLAAFARAGVRLAAGSDAPFGGIDPWASMRAAVHRRTAAGTVIGLNEALSPEDALALYLADPQDLGHSRRVAVGEPADLVLLDRDWAQARGRLSATDVRLTLIAGTVVHQRVDQPPVARHPR